MYEILHKYYMFITYVHTYNYMHVSIQIHSTVLRQNFERRTHTVSYESLYSLLFGQGIVRYTVSSLKIRHIKK